MSLVSKSGVPAPEPIGIRLAELTAPLAVGLICDDDPTGEQQLFNIAVPETEAEIQPDTMADDHGWQALAFVTVRRWCAHGMIWHTRRALDKLLNKLTMPLEPIKQTRRGHDGGRTSTGQSGDDYGSG